MICMDDFLVDRFLIHIALEKKNLVQWDDLINTSHVARCQSVGVASRRLGYRMLTATYQSGRKRSNRGNSRYEDHAIWVLGDDLKNKNPSPTVRGLNKCPLMGCLHKKERFSRGT